MSFPLAGLLQQQAMANIPVTTLQRGAGFNPGGAQQGPAGSSTGTVQADVHRRGCFSAMFPLLPRELGIPQVGAHSGVVVLPNQRFARQLADYVWFRSFIRSLIRLVPVLGVCLFVLNAVANIMEGRAWYHRTIRALLGGFNPNNPAMMFFFVLQALALATHGYLFEVPVMGSSNGVRTTVAKLQHLMSWPGCLSWTLLPLLGAGSCWLVSGWYLKELCTNIEDPPVISPFSYFSSKSCVDGTADWLLVMGAATGFCHGVHFHYGQHYLLHFTRFERRLLVQIRRQILGVLGSAMRVTSAAMFSLALFEIHSFWFRWTPGVTLESNVPIWSGLAVMACMISAGAAAGGVYDDFSWTIRITSMVLSISVAACPLIWIFGATSAHQVWGANCVRRVLIAVGVIIGLQIIAAITSMQGLWTPIGQLPMPTVLISATVAGLVVVEVFQDPLPVAQQFDTSDAVPAIGLTAASTKHCSIAAALTPSRRRSYLTSVVLCFGILQRCS